MTHAWMIELGRELGALSQRMARAEKKIDRLADEHNTIMAWGRRCVILATAWALAVSSHAGRDQASDLLASLLKAGLKF